MSGRRGVGRHEGAERSAAQVTAVLGAPLFLTAVTRSQTANLENRVSLFFFGGQPKFSFTHFCLPVQVSALNIDYFYLLTAAFSLRNLHPPSVLRPPFFLPRSSSSTLQLLPLLSSPSLPPSSSLPFLLPPLTHLPMLCHIKILYPSPDPSFVVASFASPRELVAGLTSNLRPRGEERARGRKKERNKLLGTARLTLSLSLSSTLPLLSCLWASLSLIHSLGGLALPRLAHAFCAGPRSSQRPEEKVEEGSRNGDGGNARTETNERGRKEAV